MPNLTKLTIGMSLCNLQMWEWFIRLSQIKLGENVIKNVKPQNCSSNCPHINWILDTLNNKKNLFKYKMNVKILILHWNKLFRGVNKRFLLKNWSLLNKHKIIGCTTHNTISKLSNKWLHFLHHITTYLRSGHVIK